MPQEQTGKRRFKKRYVLWIILLAGPAALVCFSVHTHTQLNERIEALRQQGYPMGPAELDVWYNESFPADVSNSWHLYDDAFWGYVEWSDQKSKNLPVYSREIQYGRGETWEPIHFADAEAFLAVNKDCLDLLYEAADTQLAPPHLATGPVAHGT